jgi:hypothetical protein
MGELYRIGAVPPKKEYVIKTVGGMFGGRTEGPYSIDDLKTLYRQHGKEHEGKLGGIFVKRLDVYRNGKLFFVAPRDGRYKEFIKKVSSNPTPLLASSQPKPATPPVTKPLPQLPRVPVLPDIPPIPQSPVDVEIGPATVEPLPGNVYGDTVATVVIVFGGLAGALLCIRAAK